jgi:hypothetical protein
MFHFSGSGGAGMVKLSLVVDVDVVGPTSDEKGARTIVKNEKESSPHTAHRLYRLPLGCGIAELWFGDFGSRAAPRWRCVPRERRPSRTRRPPSGRRRWRWPKSHHDQA